MLSPHPQAQSPPSQQNKKYMHKLKPKGKATYGEL